MIHSTRGAPGAGASLPPVALVTGASAGIGETFARELARRGYDLVLVARRAERLTALADELAQAHGVSAQALPADLTVASELARVEARLAAAPGVDLLVNNAGFGAGGLFAKSDVTREQTMLRLHVDAVLRLTHAALGPMLARGSGRVISVASLGAFMPMPFNVTYGATKAFVVAFTESLAVELAGSGVGVQALCPGFTHTEMHERAHLRTDGIPSWMWMDADRVVRASLAALATGKVVVVPGFVNRVNAGAAGLVPRGLLTALVSRMSRRTVEKIRARAAKA